jgi:hypothetical protein
MLDDGSVSVMNDCIRTVHINLLSAQRRPLKLESIPPIVHISVSENLYRLLLLAIYEDRRYPMVLLELGHQFSDRFEL